MITTFPSHTVIGARAFPSTQSTFFNSTSDNTSFNENFVLKGAATVEGYTGKSLLDTTNTYINKHRLSEYSYWLTNKNSNAVTLVSNGNEKFSMSSQ